MWRDSVYALLQIIRQELRVKRLQADAVIRFVELRRLEGKAGGEYKAEEDFLFETVRSLNKRGI